jgi:hypothetical protein
MPEYDEGRPNGTAYASAPCQGTTTYRVPAGQSLDAGVDVSATYGLPDGSVRADPDDSGFVWVVREFDGVEQCIAADLPTVIQLLRAEVPPLANAHAVFKQWLGADYDLGSLDAVLATAAVEQLDGDPIWLLVVSGSGNAKTETVSALAGARAKITSSIASEGALLSATSAKEKAKDANGGLLRELGDRGLLVIKDFTTILSMNRDLRASVLAALREVYDGRWERNVGTDGGRSLTWEGRIVLIGATTTAYDAAHGVISAMGDRFALVRVDSHIGRATSGRQALRNVGREKAMRAELADAVRNVLANVDPSLAEITEADEDALLGAANVVTLMRTAVERDQRSGLPLEAHAPEAPTRFTKMLGQIVRGGLSIGMNHDAALALALRVAADSAPPLRMAVVADVVEHPGSSVADVSRRLQRPWASIDRALQELHLLQLLAVDKDDRASRGAKGWAYHPAPDLEVEAVTALVRPGAGQGQEPDSSAPACARCGKPTSDDITVAGITVCGPCAYASASNNTTKR